jgi:hypothetical protein
LERGTSRAHRGTAAKASMFRKGRLGQIRWRSMSWLQCAQPIGLCGNHVVNKIHNARPSPCQDKHGQPATRWSYVPPLAPELARHARPTPRSRVPNPAQLSSAVVAVSRAHEPKRHTAVPAGSPHGARVPQKPENGRQKSPGTAVI